MLNVDFNIISPINGSAKDGFEEFVCQLARKEEIPCTKRFVRNGKPDGGVECYWILEDGSEVAWQAKYFCKAFDNSQYQQIDDSVNKALNAHPNLKRYIILYKIMPPHAERFYDTCSFAKKMINKNPAVKPGGGLRNRDVREVFAMLLQRVLRAFS